MAQSMIIEDEPGRQGAADYTLLHEAEQHVGSKYVDQVLDSLYVIEMAMRHFYMRAAMGKNAGRKEALVDQDYKGAATLAALVAPFRHARLSAMKLAGNRGILCISGTMPPPTNCAPRL